MVERGTALLRRMEINVAEAEKRTGKNTVNMQETYTVYLIETRPAETIAEGGTPAAPDTLWRRYSEFELFRNYLLVTYPHIIIPPLPEKRAEFVWHKLSADNLDPDFVERRRVGLENFLLRVASHPVLSDDEMFLRFLTDVTLKHYSDDLNTIISQLLRVRAKVADRLYGVYKVHGNYGRVFSEWSAIEKEMGDGLQSAGHHMDTYAASIDDILEEEEHYADQLKEYLFYTDAVRSVCRKQDLIQYELEMAVQDLSTKKQQKEELTSGTVRIFSLKGMTTKLFGQESQEQRESKLEALDLSIHEGEEAVNEKNRECKEFLQTAWGDIERFREQKDNDLREALISYAIMQISMCKKTGSINQSSCCRLMKMDYGSPNTAYSLFAVLN
uniref:PX domain-containing protein n=1 Tax=Scophthalmus maximus TaxID=52904 RepID=A0A8D3C0E4_SCOMX